MATEKATENCCRQHLFKSQVMFNMVNFGCFVQVLQSIGNFNPCVVKEPWMMPFSDFIEENAAKLKTFIDNLVGIPNNS